MAIMVIVFDGVAYRPQNAQIRMISDHECLHKGGIYEVLSKKSNGEMSILCNCDSPVLYAFGKLSDKGVIEVFSFEEYGKIGKKLTSDVYEVPDPENWE